MSAERDQPIGNSGNQRYDGRRRTSARSRRAVRL